MLESPCWLFEVLQPKRQRGAARLTSTGRQSRECPAQLKGGRPDEREQEGCANRERDGLMTAVEAVAVGLVEPPVEAGPCL